MEVLLAKKTVDGRWEKVLRFRARKDGSGPLPMKWCGTLESMVVRDAARFFAKEPKATGVHLEPISGREFRADVISR